MLGWSGSSHHTVVYTCNNWWKCMTMLLDPLFLTWHNIKIWLAFLLSTMHGNKLLLIFNSKLLAQNFINMVFIHWLPGLCLSKHFFHDTPMIMTSYIIYMHVNKCNNYSMKLRIHLNAQQLCITSHTTILVYGSDCSLLLWITELQRRTKIQDMFMF